jgi:hypothetical protein
MADDLRNTVIAILVSIAISEVADVLGVKKTIRDLAEDIKSDFTA